MGIPVSQFVEMVKRRQRLAAREPVPEPERPLSPEDKLNKTEREFYARLQLGEQGKMKWIGVQAITLKLADDCRYTPDFASIGFGGDFRLWEVKGGFVRDDAKVKLKVAARLYPFWTFLLAQKKEGVWTVEIVNQ